MTLFQIIIVLAGLFVGYRLVSYMLSSGTGDEREKSRPSPAPRSTSSDAQQNQRPWSWSDAPTSPPAQPAPLWYQTLGVRESASREEIDRAYRRQINQYHPDKVATLGADIRRVAESRSREINAAYDIAMRRVR